jgi:hypothetical protein
MAAGSLQQVKGAYGIGVKVVEGYVGSFIVAGLRRGVNNGIGLYIVYQALNARAVAYVQLVVLKGWQRRQKPLLIPTGIAGGAKKHGALIIIEAMHLPAALSKPSTNLRADKTR